jgi:hypothetical protein
MAALFRCLWVSFNRHVQLLRQEMRLRLRGLTVKKRGRLLIIDGKQSRRHLRQRVSVKIVAQAKRQPTPRAKAHPVVYHAPLPRTYIPL